MTDYYPGQSTTTHDTTALPRLDAGQQGAPPVDEAGYWAQKYQRERRRSRTLTVAAVAAAVVAAGIGISALRPTDSAAPVAAQAPAATGATQPGAAPQDGTTTPEGNLAQGGTDQLPPQGQVPGDGQAAPDQPGATSPQLPEPLRQLGATLGITDVDDLIDLAVANDLITTEQAEQLRAAVTLGAAAGQALGAGEQDA